MEILNMNGRSLKTIANEHFSEGSHQLKFSRGSLMAGIYSLQMKTDQGIMTKKIVIE
jgi:hypothetical protein